MGRLLVAEEVLAGHPDRLADAVAERIVDRALAADPEAAVAVEVAVHRSGVFVSGRVAAGGGEPFADPGELAAVVGEAYKAAGYRGRWALLRAVAADLEVAPLAHDERAVRRYSCDQSVSVGHAVAAPACGWLPPAVWAARRLRDAVASVRARHDDLLGPDGKVLVAIEGDGGRFRWRRCNVSVHHAFGVDHLDLYRVLLGPLAAAAAELDETLPGLGAWDPEAVLRLNGGGDFSCGGPAGDNGLSGKKLAVDGFGPQAPIGGGAMCGKDPHNVDRLGPLRARQVALQVVRSTSAREATVWLSWLPGLEAPDAVGALVDGEWWDEDRLRAAVAVPDLTIAASVRDLELASVCWADAAARGYFGGDAPWERA